MKCPNCGLVNFAGIDVCKRCGLPLNETESGESEESGPARRRRRPAVRILWILGVTLAVLILWYASLRFSSNSPNFDQRQVIGNAVAMIEAKGLSREAFVLKNLASFRTTDNWWNIHTGHHEAYAATNFPFEIVTLYPEFFDVTRDDTERAAILFHEAQHLLGANEESALKEAWPKKKQLGWTADHYSETKVWQNTIDLTKQLVPEDFTCGPDHHQDCFQ